MPGGGGPLLTDLPGGLTRKPLPRGSSADSLDLSTSGTSEGPAPWDWLSGAQLGSPPLWVMHYVYFAVTIQNVYGAILNLFTDFVTTFPASLRHKMQIA